MIHHRRYRDPCLDCHGPLDSEGLLACLDCRNRLLKQNFAVAVVEGRVILAPNESWYETGSRTQGYNSTWQPSGGLGPPLDWSEPPPPAKKSWWRRNRKP